MNTLMKDFLPFAQPSIGEEEIEEVVNVMRSGWLTTGAKAKTFEEDFANYIGSKHAIAVNSATAGLHLALEAVGIKSGDQVITTPYTFTATAEVIRYLGANPLFVDIDPQTFNLDPQYLEEAFQKNPNVKAIIPVHFAGQACDMEPILAFAKKHQLHVIEDAAHALPTTYKNKLIGTLSDIAVYSFYATKTITTGEGGMIVTDNDDLVKRMETMRLHGISHNVFNRYTSSAASWYYEVVAPGYKYNMPDLMAAIGIQQLKKAQRFQERREEIATCYTKAFEAESLPLKVPVQTIPEDQHSWHLYAIQLELDRLTIDRNEFIEMMKEKGIGTSVHFIPLHIQPYWKERYNFAPEDFPVALDVYQRVVSLPIYPKMSNEQVERVIEAVKEILKTNLR